MQVHLELPRESVLPASVVTVGTFDGVHRGHQLLTEKTREVAARLGVPSAVVTFQEMPFCYFRPDACPHLLTLPDEKIEAFARTNVDHLWIVPFDKSVAQLSAQEFAGDLLRDKIGMRALVCGPDFALGRERGGTVAALRQIGVERGFETLPLDAKLIEGERSISSTRAREAVESGHVALAARLLGREFSLSGVVESGRQLGRTIGFPTLNLRPHTRKAVPARGVYVVRASLDGGDFLPSVMNIGVRPTVSGVDETLEVHVLNANIQTPHEVRVSFVEHLRDEQKFAGVDELKMQLARDVAAARRVLAPGG